MHSSQWERRRQMSLHCSQVHYQLSFVRGYETAAQISQR